MATNPRIAGLLEGNVAPGSGLAYRQFRMLAQSSATYFVNAQVVGAAGSFATFTLNNRIQAYGGTLVAQIVQGAPVAGTVKLRVRGYDQFHEYVDELTPTLTLAAKTNNFIYLAKVFVHVDRVDLLHTGLAAGGDTLSLGRRWDWTQTIDATNNHIAGTNLGLPLPLRSGRRVGPTTRTPFNFTQRVGPAITKAPPASVDRRPLEILGLTIQDMTGAGSPIQTVASDKIEIGQSASGWIGTPDKLAINDATAVSQWAITDNIQVIMQMLSADNVR